MPHNPNPPIKMDAPSGMSRIASAALLQTLLTLVEAQKIIRR
jgi:hypothetical protein